jgi:hypothetical protein
MSSRRAAWDLLGAREHHPTRTGDSCCRQPNQPGDQIGLWLVWRVS